jgi:hypothetical protein
MRLRWRPLRNLATNRPFSYSAKAPATWRIIFLHHQLAGKPTGVLNNDSADAVALDLVEQSREALAALDRIGAADGGVVVLGHDLEASTLGEALAQ